MKKQLFALLVGMSLVLAACGTGEEEASDRSGGTTTPVTEGEKIFQQSSCAQCHGKDLREGYAPDLDKVGSKYSQEEIEKIIKEGRPGMAGGLLKGEDAKTVAAWLAEHK